jgi:ABC-type Fe3+ transport system permease subunit
MQHLPNWATLLPFAVPAYLGDGAWISLWAGFVAFVLYQE